MRRTAATLLLLAVAGSAIADTPDDARPAPLLTGPTVVDDAPPGADDSFAPGMQDPRMRTPPVDLRQLGTELRALAADDADPELRLSTAQRDEAWSILATFARETRAYRRQHREEIAELRAAAEDEDADPKARAEAVRQLETIRAELPGGDEAYRRIWDLLTEPQRAHVETRLAEVRAERELERELRRSEGQVRRELERLGLNGDGELSPELVERIIQRLPERARERLERLSPEQRADAVKRILERRRQAPVERLERQRQRRDNMTTDSRGGERPAPSMDNVIVPEANE